ncbi:MAG: DNA recombination/repair protein RecA, partial [Desulfovibrionaceae bacterium]|nr:DNA recombination/repair protein RecA [Desulfovibrionaceae bacterium]
MARKPTASGENARIEALSTALSTIERKYGKGAVMKLSDEAHVNIPVIPTGSIGLDLALGVGGIPRGRITEIFG